MNLSMVRRLALLIAAVLAPALLGSLLILTLALRGGLRQQWELRNQEAASAVAVTLAQSPGDLARAQELVSNLFESGNFQRLLVLDGQGRATLTRVAPRQDSLAPGWFVRLLPLRAAPGTVTLAAGAGAWAQLQIETQSAGAHDLLWVACSRAAALLAALAVAALLAALWVLRAWRRPLNAAVAQARALEQGRFVLADEPAWPELRELTRSMNAMVGRLRQLFGVQAEQVARLQRQAQTDAVTGLPLRRQFVSRLQDLLAESASPGGALLLVRVLRLDLINQRLGRESTDRLLGSLADVLQSYVDRVPGAFAGRLNGSDFGLCLPVAGVAQETADSLFAALTASPVARLGAAEYALGGVDGLRGMAGGAALAAADLALAQSEARGVPVVEAVLDQFSAGPGERAWRSQIGQALDEGRVCLAEYPVLDAQGKLIHLECPLRVQFGADGEFHAAQRWLGLALRSRLMPRVDMMALDLALAATTQDGRPRCIHVAPASLAEPGFVAGVRARLAERPLAAQRLFIEWVASS